MRLLVTGAVTPYARALFDALPKDWSVRALTPEPAELPSGVEAVPGDCRDHDFIKSAVYGVDSVVHFEPLATGGADLERLDRATRGTYNLVVAMRVVGVKRLVLGSTLDLFSRLPAGWNVTEAWRPRPEPQMGHLAPWLAELSVREAVRDGAVRAICLRFGGIGERVAAWTRLYPEDAAQATLLALSRSGENDPREWWETFHIVSGGQGTQRPRSEAAERKLGYVPRRTYAAEYSQEEMAWGRDWRARLRPLNPMPSRAIRSVVIFGAGGPVGTAVAEELRTSYRLRLTDSRPLAEIQAENKPQFPGAPVARPLDAPHENLVVDVRDPVAVSAACENMDAIINLSVVRPDSVDAFRVNTLGAYNIARAAVEHRIRRVVQTGPQLVEHGGWDAYERDYDVPGDSPPRPGVNLYFHSKYLGQEALRVFADNFGLEAPVLLFCQFSNPEVVTGLHPFAISWQDSARAIRRAVETCAFPSPYEVMNVMADVPHGRYDNSRAKTLLDWQPRDDLVPFWVRRPPSE